MAAPKTTEKKFSKLWPWFFFTAAFESVLAAASLLLIPSEGLSLARLALLGILFALTGLEIFLGLRARQHPEQWDSLAGPLGIFAAALLALTSGLILFLLRYLDPEKLIPYYERLSPLLWLLLALGVQAALFFALIRNGFQPRKFFVDRSSWVASAVLFAVFLFVAFTRIGVAADTAYWGEPGPAMQGWQFVLSILLGLGALLFAARYTVFLEKYWFILPLFIFNLALTLWLSVPVDVLQNSFYAPITPPANIPFPYSDAGFYDYLAQSLLIGADYFHTIPPRPLYVAFLAVLHWIFGQDYPAIITAQTVVLAFFPVILYVLGKKIHSPAAGVIAALFAIFRELVSLWISSNTRVANSKIFTTDFPTAMGIALLCLVVLWWLERRDLRSTLVAGGAFGLLLLFRTQSLFTLPAVILISFFAYRRNFKDWFLSSAVFGTAMVIAVMPWLIHNHGLTGSFAFDDPRQVAIIYSQYSLESNLDISQFNPETDSVSQRMISFTLEHPGFVARFITSHFLNTEIGGLLALPLIKPFDGLLAPVNLYWMSWDGTLEWYNIVLVLFYLLVLALGIGAAWRRMGWLGLVPLGFNLGYALANGISRFSSWRYNLPVDWVVYFYFAIGAIELLARLTAVFGAKYDDEIQPVPARPFSLREFRPQFILILLGFAFVGGFPWLAKGFAEPHYTSTPQEMTRRLENAGYPANEVQEFLSQPNAVLLEGMLLYPRMYTRGEGVSSANPWPAYAIRDDSRMGFIVIGDQRYDAIYPTRELLNLPHAADVTLLGCQMDGYVEVRIMDVDGQTFESAPLSQACN